MPNDTNPIRCTRSTKDPLVKLAEETQHNIVPTLKFIVKVTAILKKKKHINFILPCISQKYLIMKHLFFVTLIMQNQYSKKHFENHYPRVICYE